MSYLKVEGHDGLVRDTNTGAIINNSRSDYEAYLIRKKQTQVKNDEIARHSQEIDSIKSELGEIKQLLLSLINK